MDKISKQLYRGQKNGLGNPVITTGLVVFYIGLKMFSVDRWVISQLLYS